MSPYPTDRFLAPQLQLNPEAVEVADADEDVEWLLSFLSADRLKSYCLYQSAAARVISDPGASEGTDSFSGS